MGFRWTEEHFLNEGRRETTRRNTFSYTREENKQPILEKVIKVFLLPKFLLNHVAVVHKLRVT